MKYLFNENDTIIQSDFMPVNSDGHIDGDVIPHKEVVFEVYFYIDEYDKSGVPTEMARKVVLDKNYILDLAKKIAQIEQNVIDMKYLDLPF